MRSLGGFLRNLSFWFPSACIAAFRLRQLAHQGFCRCHPSLLSRCESVPTVQRRRGSLIRRAKQTLPSASLLSLWEAAARRPVEHVSGYHVAVVAGVVPPPSTAQRR